MIVSADTEPPPFTDSTFLKTRSRDRDTACPATPLVTYALPRQEEPCIPGTWWAGLRAPWCRRTPLPCRKPQNDSSQCPSRRRRSLGLPNRVATPTSPLAP